MCDEASCKEEDMTNDQVEKIIKSNMMLQMNFAGIKADFEEASQKQWVGLTKKDKSLFSSLLDHKTDDEVFTAIDNLLKERNT
jgi:hypothetical protein